MQPKPTKSPGRAWREDTSIRFWAKVRREGECLIWTGSTTGSGYGHIHVSGKFVQAHRVAYELLVGPIPDGLDLDHLCRNRLCCEPDHLEPVTRRENLMRGPTVPARNAAKTHCPHGHVYTSENTYLVRQPNGRHARQCRTCVLDRSRARYQRLRALR